MSQRCEIDLTSFWTETLGDMGKQEIVKWKAEEERLLLALVTRIGKNWVEITLQFPGRSKTCVRNKFLRLQKRGKANNRCDSSGKEKVGHVCKTLALMHTVSEKSTPVAPESNSGVATSATLATVDS